MRYDYEIISQGSLTQDDFRMVLKNMGAEEWELVSVTQIHTPIEKTTAYLKREIKVEFTTKMNPVRPGAILEVKKV